MNDEVRTPEGPGLGIHRPKPRRVAQQLERYMGIVMAAAAVVLLGVLAYGVMNTGSGTPAWMH